MAGMISFKDKTVLITGGSRGIGAAAVSLFAELQANVAFNYHRDEQAAANLYEKIKSFGAGYYYSACEINTYKQVSNFVDTVIDKLGRIDILVNNAGIWEYGAVDTMSIQDWQRTIDINLNSVFYFSKKVVCHMKENKISGRLIHISSTAGQRGEAYHSHYAASKGAIISFTKSLATELGPYGITVNCVAPGWVQTDMAAEAIKEDGQKIVEDIPLGRIPDAKDIAGPIVFLASDWAKAITGEILNVNAGSVLCG
jgi:3-oxoacyl-[acyl-carrier protein] reductase